MIPRAEEKFRIGVKLRFMGSSGNAGIDGRDRALRVSRLEGRRPGEGRSRRFAGKEINDA